MAIHIGFYICHCGINIAFKVRVEEVAAFVRKLPNVVVARDYKFMCSDPGQEMIEKDIKEFGLNRVVVASCSPRLHEKTFQGACQRAGLNPYMFQMASVREQVSWVTKDEDEATRKAKTLAAAAVNRVGHHHELQTREVNVHPDVLVVGGGIAGMQAALDIGNSGHKVYLVEKDTTLADICSSSTRPFRPSTVPHVLEPPKWLKWPRIKYRVAVVQRGQRKYRDTSATLPLKFVANRGM